MTTLDFALQIKSADDTGGFEGYASTFGGPPDSYGDIIEPGAFGDSLARHRREGSMPLMLWGHDPNEPIGVWSEFAEDGKGLWCKGALLKGVQKADEAYIRLKAGAVRGLSIGYHELETQPDGNARRLKRLHLIEVSIVAMPANRRARVQSVKTENYALLRNRLMAGEPPSVREWEKGLRDAFDLSRAEAEKAVRLCLKDVAPGEPGESRNEPDAAAVLATLRDALSGFLTPTA